MAPIPTDKRTDVYLKLCELVQKERESRMGYQSEDQLGTLGSISAIGTT
jgi:hypothetical protein